MAPQPRRRPPRRLRDHLVQAAGVTVVAAAVATALLPGGLDVTGMSDTSDPTSQTRVETPETAQVRSLMARYDCSTEGFGQTAIPRSAIIRRPQGTIELVSFDRGWQVFKDHGPTSLVAVCLRPPR
ncbi:hypothetical protein ACT8ZV_13865 [Nocardioides sp. MAHUQ-72]|uniref:hypothetical protein n=1 Tax=unclassified Nocardioides TaxID=2615069 RepID=UPI003613EC5C